MTQRAFTLILQYTFDVEYTQILKDISMARNQKSVNTRKVYKCFIASPGDTTSERKICRSVVKFLHKKGYSIEAYGWEDVMPNMNGKRPQAQINQLLAECDIFIGIMSLRYGSPTAKASSGTIEEFNEAFQENQISGGRSPQILFYFKEHKWTPRDKAGREQHDLVCEFREDLEKKRIGMYQTYRNGTEFKNLLRKNLPNAIKELERSLLEEVRINKNSPFIGRNKDIVAIQKLLSQGHLMLTAPSGIGKTTLLQHLCHHPAIRKEYTVIRWITLNRDLLIEKDPTAFRRAFIEKFSLEYIDDNSDLSCDWTERFNSCVANHYRLSSTLYRARLLIIDNLDYISDKDYACLRSLLTNDYGWRLIIITRGIMEQTTLIQKYQLHHLEEEKCVDLFEKIYKSAFGLGFNRDAALALIKQLEYNTNIIGIVATHAAEVNTASFGEYCANSEYYVRAKGLKEFFVSVLGTLPPEERQLLILMIALTSIPIPRAMLKKLLDPHFGDSWGMVLNSLLRKQWVKAFEQKASINGKTGVEVLYQCHSFSKQYFRGLSKITTTDINPIVNTMAELVKSYFIVEWTEVSQWIPYAKSLLDCVPSIEHYDGDMFVLAYNYLDSSRKAGLLAREETLEHIINLIKQIEKRMLGSLPLSKLLYDTDAEFNQEEMMLIQQEADSLLLLSRLYNTRARIYAEDTKNQSERNEALSLRSKNLNMAKAIASISREHGENYALTLRYLGASYRVKKDYSQAEAHIRKSISVLNTLISEDPNDKKSRIFLADSHDALGFVYSNRYLSTKDKKDIRLGLEHREHALNIKQKVLGQESLSYLSTLSNCAAMYSKAADQLDNDFEKATLLDKAFNAYEKCREIREAKLPSKHTVLAYVYNGLCNVYRKKRLYLQARAFNAKSEDIAKSAKSYPTQRWGIIYRNKALIAKDQEYWDEAETNINLAIKCFKESDLKVELSRSEEIKKEIECLRKNSVNHEA